MSNLARSHPAQTFETRRFIGHRNVVSALAWNNDGSRLLAAGDASGVCIFDTAYLADGVSAQSSQHQHHQHQGVTSKVLLECRGHNKKISALLPSPTSPHMLASAAFDHLLNVFDTRAGNRPVHSFTLPSACLYADWSPDGNTIGVGLASDSISFVDCLTWALKPEKEKRFHTGDVNQFRWSMDNSKILFGRYNGYVDVFDWPSLTHIISFRGHVNTALTIACDPKDRYYAVASTDSCVSIWDAPSITNLYTIDRRDVAIRFLDYSAEGKMLAVAGDYDGVDIVDAEDGSHMHLIPTSTWVSAIAWHPSKSFLAYSPHKPTSSSGRDRYAQSEYPPVCVWGPSSRTK